MCKKVFILPFVKACGNLVAGVLQRLGKKVFKEDAMLRYSG
jgi:hypothetical protein